MADIFHFADQLGPAKIIHVYQPQAELKGILVVDNVATGPAIGGCRMAADASVEECFRLARAMTLKNAAAGLPHGGGKSVIIADPKMAVAEKERLIRAFAVALGDVKDYIFGPDMGTNETCMAWVRDEIGRAVGLPAEIGGIPLDEIGATGFGVCAAIDVAKDFCELDLKGARIVVQGFGSVGKHAARLLAEQGAILIAASDSAGTVYDPQGLDVSALIAFKDGGHSLTEFAQGEKLEREAIVGIACDVWIPAARPDVLHAANVARLQTRIVAQGANIPATAEAEQILHKRGILVLPDFIANAGGVICAAVEYAGGNKDQAFSTIEDKIRSNTRLMLESALAQQIPPRQAALALAEQRVRKAMSLQRRF